jgi:hypothetical protein
MRKILIVIGTLVVIGAAIGTGVYYFTRGVADAATGFFASIASAGPQAAYRRASPAFQQAISESDFAVLANRVGLTHFKSASWPERKVENGQGSVSGTLALDNNVSLPAKVQLTKNAAGEWQVFHFNLTLPGAATAQPSASQPTPNRPPQSRRPKIASSTAAGDEISAQIGDKPWLASGTSLITLKFGNAVIVSTAPVVKADHTIDSTSLTLQFDTSATGSQKFIRNCAQQAPCIELDTNGNHYKIDDSPNAQATLMITRMEAGKIEGDFSADMIALEGKLTLRQGHFAVTVK